MSAVLEQTKAYKVNALSTGWIFILFIILPFMAQGQQHKGKAVKTVVVYGEDISTEDDIGPPPPNLKSEFKTLQDWLVSICNGEKPKKLISTYNIGLSESNNRDYTLDLTGRNAYNEGNNHSSKRIEFTPKHTFYKLPEAYYKSLSREQLIKKLITQLKDFTNTKDFKNSFFTKANAIVFDTNGQKIWSKQ